MPVSNVTLTPVYIDYTNGAAWSSLGNQAAYQAAINQVFTDLGNALYFPNGAKEFKYQVGLNAFGTSAVDTTGTALGAGVAAESGPYITLSPTYASYRSQLIALSPQNSLQQVAYNLTNLPVSNPVSDPTFEIRAALAEAIGLHSYATGVIAAGIGIKSASYTDTDQHGLGAGPNVYAGIFHELSECIGRVGNSELWWWGSPGVRQTDGTQSHYLAYDQGSTASKIYDLGLAGGGDDYDVINLQSSFDQTKPTGAVCRDANTPGFAKDWLDITIHGFTLSDLGNSWAGLMNTTYGFSPGLKR